MGRSLYFSKDKIVANWPKSKCSKKDRDLIESLQINQKIKLNFNLDDIIFQITRTPSTYGIEPTPKSNSLTYIVKNTNWDPYFFPDGVRGLVLEPYIEPKYVLLKKDNIVVDMNGEKVFDFFCEKYFGKPLSDLQVDDEIELQINEKPSTIIGYFKTHELFVVTDNTFDKIYLKEKFFTDWILTTDGFICEVEGLGVQNHVSGITLVE